MAKFFPISFCFLTFGSVTSLPICFYRYSCSILCWYVYLFICIYKFFFCLCIIESVREFSKYSGKVRDDDLVGAASPKYYEDQMRLFRAQRNFYISGYSLFCLFIIKRLAGLISQQAIYQAEAEASRRQAENMSKHIETLTTNSGDSGNSAGTEELLLIADLNEMNEKLRKDLQALKKQAESTNKEYDRLTGEYAALQVSAIHKFVYKN